MVNSRKPPLPNPEEGGFEGDLYLMNAMAGYSANGVIPWNEYSEIEIQTLLKMHFEGLGFDVTWRHRDDPANEEGIDLECRRKSDGQTTIIAVKRHPRKEALAQVLQLAHQEADKRIYVYVGGAVQSFRDEIKTFEPGVEFWNEKRLQSSLNKSGLALDLVFANSIVNAAMLSIMRDILRAIDDKSCQSLTSKPSAQTMDSLWGLKDRVVIVHKCATMAQLLFEKWDGIGMLNRGVIDQTVIYVMDFLYGEGFFTLQRSFDHMSPELQSLLRRVYVKTATRSNWIQLFLYHPGLRPGSVERMYSEASRRNGELRKSLEALKEKAKVKHLPKLRQTHPLSASDWFRYLNAWAGGLEGTIDDMFTEYALGGVEK